MQELELQQDLNQEEAFNNYDYDVTSPYYVYDTDPSTGRQFFLNERGNRVFVVPSSNVDFSSASPSTIVPSVEASGAPADFSSSIVDGSGSGVQEV